jgi:hypothetical protein
MIVSSNLDRAKIMLNLQYEEGGEQLVPMRTEELSE